MLFKTEEEAVRAAESMTEAACDARAVISYRVYRLAGAATYRVTEDVAPRHKRWPLVAWFHSDGMCVKRYLVGR